MRGKKNVEVYKKRNILTRERGKKLWKSYN